MMRRCLVVLSCLAAGLLVGPPPAAAAGGTVQLRYSPSFTQLIGEGWLTGAVCQAVAAAPAGEVVLATSVRCRINAFQSEWRTLPGDRSAIQVVNVTSAPVRVCADGVGTFAAPDGLPYLVSVSGCITMPT